MCYGARILLSNLQKLLPKSLQLLRAWLLLYTTHSFMHSISKTSGIFLMHFPLGRVVYASGPLLTGGPVPRTWRPDPLQVLWHISASYAFFSLGPVVAADPCHLLSNTADKLPSSANTTYWSMLQIRFHTGSRWLNFNDSGTSERRTRSEHPDVLTITASAYVLHADDEDSKMD